MRSTRLTNTIDTTYSAIPLDAGRIQGWKTMPIRETHPFDPLVPLGPLSQEASGLMTSSVYFGEHNNSPYAKDINKLSDSLLTIFARRSVARRLLVAEQLLPAGHHLLIFDAYRPYRVQKSLYDFYKRKLEEKHPKTDNETLDSETQKYVALPSQDPMRPSQHNTGGAVDLAIVKLTPVHERELLHIRSRLVDANLDLAKRVDLELRLSAIIKHTKMLWFGTAFDHGGEKSALAYYESRIAAREALNEEDMLACTNRRLLYRVMTQAGFQPYFAEWWHFNAPEIQTGAATAGRGVATLGGVELNEDNRAHENKRLNLRQEMLRPQKEGDPAVVPTALQAEILATIYRSGDPRTGGDWPIEIIAPPEE